ncbi:MAG: protein kinase, partial [Candidatus Eisenbacteria bacterium]|nr:protein kinase [Candidatus Latescibacterota bacterium]MBD3302749.1 protein kinase [Candidatus Eisenbacteria bacterium]
MSDSRLNEPTPEAWSRISAILDEALSRPLEQRDAYVVEACGNDDGLRREVSTLLRAAGEDRSFLDENVLEFVAPALEEGIADDALREGERIGPYRVGRLIGRGGMSRVYLIERDDDQFHRVAALKVLDVPGPDSVEYVRRFEAERQILASLDHPNIAALYDAGSTRDGRPCLILEHVSGEPITRYCASRRLGVEDRLLLFETVCRAVHYAHQRLVVHRDLKPGNIFVRRDGVVKLLDFGIAKLLDEGESSPGARAPRTRTGFRFLTPEYAAPEQIRSEPVTVATDVYALGVLLFELLTGRLPYDLDRGSPFSTQVAVVQEEPKTASTVVSSEADRRTLRGDLDAICHRALRKEPMARYASVAELAADVRAHLDHEPVVARAGTVRYRFGRFVRRNRVPVLATGLVVLSLAAGLIVSIVQTRSASRAFQEARLAELRATAINTFLVEDLLGAADPVESGNHDIALREVLDVAARRVGTAFADEPLVEASVRQTLARVYRSLGEYATAHSHND